MTSLDWKTRPTASPTAPANSHTVVAPTHSPTAVDPTESPMQSPTSSNERIRTWGLLPAGALGWIIQPWSNIIAIAFCLDLLPSILMTKHYGDTYVSHSCGHTMARFVSVCMFLQVLTALLVSVSFACPTGQAQLFVVVYRFQSYNDDYVSDDQYRLQLSTTSQSITRTHNSNANSPTDISPLTLDTDCRPWNDTTNVTMVIQEKECNFLCIGWHWQQKFSSSETILGYTGTCGFTFREPCFASTSNSRGDQRIWYRYYWEGLSTTSPTSSPTSSSPTSTTSPTSSPTSSSPTSTTSPTTVPFPTISPTVSPSVLPSVSSTLIPTIGPTTTNPTSSPTVSPTALPTIPYLTTLPTTSPTTQPTVSPWPSQSSVQSSQSDSSDSSLYIIIIGVLVFVILLFAIAVIRWRKARKPTPTSTPLPPDNPITTSNPAYLIIGKTYNEIGPKLPEYETPIRHNPAYETRPAVYNLIEIKERVAQPYALLETSHKTYEIPLAQPNASLETSHKTYDIPLKTSQYDVAKMMTGIDSHPYIEVVEMSSRRDTGSFA